MKHPSRIRRRPLNHIRNSTLRLPKTVFQSRIWVFRKCVTRLRECDVYLIAKQRDKWLTPHRSGRTECKSRKIPVNPFRSPQIHSRLLEMRLLRHTPSSKSSRAIDSSSVNERSGPVDAYFQSRCFEWVARQNLQGTRGASTPLPSLASF